MSRRRPRRGVDQKGRTLGRDQFWKLDRWMLHSPAWMALLSVERALYIEVLQRYNGHNNGQIVLGVREAGEALHIKPHTAGRGFDYLVALGFLKVARQSAFSLKTREAREWAVTALAVGDALPTKDFMHWRGERPDLHPPKKQNTVPFEDTDGSPKRHCDAPTVSPNGTDGVPKRHRQRQKRHSDGVPKRHTSNLPGGVDSAVQAADLTPSNHFGGGGSPSTKGKLLQKKESHGLKNQFRRAVDRSGRTLSSLSACRRRFKRRQKKRQKFSQKKHVVPTESSATKSSGPTMRKARNT